MPSLVADVAVGSISDQHTLSNHLAQTVRLQGRTPRHVRRMSALPPTADNTGGQPAINNSDGLPNVRPIAFSESLRNQLSHNVIFSAALVPPRNL
jgi:hypothetical protein